MRTAALVAELKARRWQVHYAISHGIEAANTALEGMGIDITPLRPHEAMSGPALKAAFPGGVDIALLDHYGLDIEFEAGLAGWARHVAAIDDGPRSRRHDVDLLIDATPGIVAGDWREAVSARTNVLAGANYALIRPEIVAQRDASLAARETGRPVRRVAISFGTSDSHNAAELALRAARNALPTVTLDVLISKTSVHATRVMEAARSLDAQLHVDAPNYPAILAEADLAIGAGGVSALERACIGLPSIIIALAQNQMRLATALADIRIAHFIGTIDAVTLAKLAAAVEALANDTRLRGQMSARGAEFVDGRGCARVADALETICRSPLAVQQTT